MNLFLHSPFANQYQVVTVNPASERPKSDSRCVEQYHEGNDPPNSQHRESEFPPSLQRNAGNTQDRHRRTAGRGNAVGEGIAHLEGKNGSLTSNTDKVSQRCHDWHRDGSLTGTGRYNEVEDILYDEHADTQE